MTTNGTSKPATRENLRTATDAWKADTTYPSVVGRFVTESLYEAASGDIDVLAQELSQVTDSTYLEWLETLAEVGMAIADWRRRDDILSMRK